MTQLALLLAVPGAPLLLALMMGLPALRGAAWRLLPLVPLPALALVLGMPVPVEATSPWLGMGAQFGLGEMSRLFLGFVAVLWVAAGATARHWMTEDPRATGFGVFFLLAMAGNLGLVISLDAASFYAFFALMSFASYGLVIHSRSAAALSAGWLYISFVVAGELALFTGLVLAASEAGSLLLADLRAIELSGLSVSLLLLGFGAKLGVMPLHFWLPPAHGAAPVPASAVLSGAMIKAGLFGLLTTLPLGIATMPDHGVVVMSAGLVTVFAAVLLGLSQDSPKAVLGFSSVSQMGIIALGLGAGLMAPAAWPLLLGAVVFLAAHHALAKGALFLGVGVFGSREGNAGRAIILVLLAVPALVLAGLTGTSGALGKEALKLALAEGPVEWRPWLGVALTLSGLATTLLMARFAVTLWRAAPTSPRGAATEALAMPFVGLAAAAISLPLVWPAAAGALATPLAGLAPADPLPIALGIVLALGALIRAHAVTVGPRVFFAALAHPFTRAHGVVVDWLSHRRRAARRTVRAVTTLLAEKAGAARLGQTAIAALIAIVFAVEALATLRSSYRAASSEPPARAATLQQDASFIPPASGF